MTQKVQSRLTTYNYKSINTRSNIQSSVNYD